MAEAENDQTAAQVADEFNDRWYGVKPPRFGPDLPEPCLRRHCRGRVPHSRLHHWFGWVRS